MLPALSLCTHTGQKQNYLRACWFGFYFFFWSALDAISPNSAFFNKEFCLEATREVVAGDDWKARLCENVWFWKQAEVTLLFIKV